MDILLIQPRHVYAPEFDCGELGHIYMPTSLLTVASQLLAAGFNVGIEDENFSQVTQAPGPLGVNVIGPPYISAAKELQTRLLEGGSKAPLLLGGQGVAGLTRAQMSTIYGESVINGNHLPSLAHFFSRAPQDFLAQEGTSLVPAYERISDERMKAYLSTEFCLFVSQGCRFSCTFCAAERTRFNQIEQAIQKVRERYRSVDVIEADLRYLLSRAQKLGIRSLSLYLSNLDLFQTINKLEELSDLLGRLRREFTAPRLRLRGLATSTSFLDAHRKRPEVIRKMAEGGLVRIGFGIDGSTPKVWKAVHKPHTSDVCINAIMVCREVYGITPEALMVFGHNGVDDADSLQLATQFLLALREDYGAIPRPHVAKDLVPGNDGWQDARNTKRVEYLLAKPESFQLLDFTAAASWFSHPDGRFRKLVNDAFSAACQIPGSQTQFVLPEDPEVPMEELQRRKEFNLRRYDT